MRLVGPNCLGVVQHRSGGAAQRNLRRTARTRRVGSVWSRSPAALGIAVIAAAARWGLGISQFVSVGNKADVSSNDLLLAWEDDDRTRVIALYLESFGNPRKFARIARSGRSRASRSSPSRPVGRQPGSWPVSRTPRRRPPRTSSSMRCSPRPGCSGWTPCSRCWTPPGCSATNRCRAGPGSPWSAIPVVRASSPRTPRTAPAWTWFTLRSETEELLRQAVPTAAVLPNPVDLGAAVATGSTGVGGAAAAARCRRGRRRPDGASPTSAVTDSEQVMSSIARSSGRVAANR